MKHSNGYSRTRRSRQGHIWIATITTITLWVLSVAPAMASGSSDWIKPGMEVMDDLMAGLTLIGPLVIGLGVVIFGIIAGLSGRIDWSKAGMIVLGGLLVGSGPALVKTLLF